MNTVKGNNVIIEVLISGIYYPIFCGKTMEFTQSQDVVEITSVNSQSSREYQAGLTTSSLSISGVTILDNTGGNISVTYFMQPSIRRAAQTMRISLTDDDGGSLQIAFSAIITNNTFSRARGTYSQSSMGLTVTGEPTMSAIVPDPGVGCPEVPLYLSVVAGQTSVSDALLTAVGVVILEVNREGLQHDEVVGTPGNRQFSFTAGTGSINFDPTNPFNTGETIYILYKIV